jgi:hypothetical protein
MPATSASMPMPRYDVESIPPIHLLESIPSPYIY